MTHDTQPAKDQDSRKNSSCDPNAIIERALRSGSQGFGRDRASPAALAGAVAAALREAGYKIVPREPSEAMITAAKKLYATPPEFVDVSFDDYWLAMWDAAE